MEINLWSSRDSIDRNKTYDFRKRLAWNNELVIDVPPVSTTMMIKRSSVSDL